MFSEKINDISMVAEKKAKYLEKTKTGYLVAAALAGIYVGFGILLIFTIGGMLSTVNSPFTKIIMGLSFGIALSLVLMAGSELFTGTNMIMTVGSLEKKTSWSSALKIWIYSFIGNFIGAIVLAALFVGSGLGKGDTDNFILKISAIKMSLPYEQLFIRGILCNILVCLAVWCFLTLKEETAKLVMIFWCLFAFITSGYEHSVANMTLLATALFLPHGKDISINGLVHNMVPVTLGNFIGGAVFVGAAYWFISKNRK